MLGPEELRLLEETIGEEFGERPQNGRRSPYLSPAFATGVAVTKAVAGNLKRFDPFARKR
ncbi:MAG: hypothetical protein ACM31L_06195 [Actinomycetota bacterium]